MITCPHCLQEISAAQKQKIKRAEEAFANKQNRAIIAALKKSRVAWAWNDELPYAQRRGDLWVFGYTGERRPVILRGARKGSGTGQNDRARRFITRAVRMFKLTVLDARAWHANATVKRIEDYASDRWGARAALKFPVPGGPWAFIGGEQKWLTPKQRLSLVPFVQLYTAIESTNAPSSSAVR